MKFFIHIMWTNGRNEVLPLYSEESFRACISNLTGLVIDGTCRTFTPYVEK